MYNMNASCAQDDMFTVVIPHASQNQNQSQIVKRQITVPQSIDDQVNNPKKDIEPFWKKNLILIVNIFLWVTNWAFSIYSFVVSTEVGENYYENTMPICISTESHCKDIVNDLSNHDCIKETIHNCYEILIRCSRYLTIDCTQSIS